MTNNEIDICCVVETWLDTNIPTESVDLDGYVLHRRDRSDGRQCGGVAAYVRCSLPCIRVPELETPLLETLWLLYRCPRMPRSVSHLLIGVIYHPPDAVSRVMTDHLLDVIDNIMKRHPSAGIILLGDFNHMYDSPLRQFPMKQTVKSATRGSAILDKIYSNIAEWYLLPMILPETADSDHRTVLALPIHSNVKRGERCEVVVRSNDPNGKNLLARALTSINWTQLYHMNDVEAMTSHFYATVTSLVNMYLPERTVVRHTTNKPWVTDDFCRLVRQRQYAWTSGDMVKYRALRNRVNRLSVTLRKRFCQKRIQNLRRCNASNWWKETKRLTGQSNKSDLAGLAASECDGDFQQLSELINISLKQVSSDLQPLQTNQIFPDQNVPSQFVIFPDEIYNKLSRINTRKAPGPDGLPNWILKEFAFTLADPICSIFNASVRQCTVPTIWKSANVVPIPKVKPALSVDSDLRPISLTPTLSKLLESFVGQWMLEAIGNNFDVKQFGGLRGRSTIHALIDILQPWHAALDADKLVRVLFIDYAKAFDHVDHSTILRKMATMGIPDFITRWMFSFLADRQQRVKIGNYLSQWVKLNGGMPQGTWLGLYIFLILINDLKSTEAQLDKYVDDVTATETLRKGELSNMQQVLDDVYNWSNNNHMNINVKKTKEMILGAVNTNPPPALQLAGRSIECVQSFKLLGVTVNNKLTWNDNISCICSKAAKRLHFLKLLKRSGMPTDDLLYYYSAVIRPVLEYGCVIWHSSLTIEQTHHIDAIQRRAERIIGLTECAGKLAPLKERREEQAKCFFESLKQPTSCLHDIFPPKRDQLTIERLRHAKQYPVPTARTERYRRSFLVHALSQYQ